MIVIVLFVFVVMFWFYLFNWECLLEIYGVLLLVVIVVLLVGLWVVCCLFNVMLCVIVCMGVDLMLGSFLCNVVYVVLLVIVVVLVIGMFGVQIILLLVVFGIVGLVVGFVLKDLLFNIVLGVMLVMLWLFCVGDVVIVVGQIGMVCEVCIFQIVIIGVDNQYIIILNMLIIVVLIINFIVELICCVELVIGIGYEDNIQLVCDIVLVLMKVDLCVLQMLVLDVVVYELGVYVINFGICCYVKLVDWFGIKVMLLEQFKLGFDKVGINILYLQQDMYLYLYGKDGGVVEVDVLVCDKF